MASDFFVGVVDVVVRLATGGNALLTVHAVGVIQAKFLKCNGVMDCVVPVHVITSALVASGLAVSTAVCMVVLLNLLLSLISAKEILSPVSGAADVILFGFIVALVGTTVAHVHHVAV